MHGIYERGNIAHGESYSRLMPQLLLMIIISKHFSPDFLFHGPKNGFSALPPGLPGSSGQEQTKPVLNPINPVMLGPIDIQP